MATTQGRAGMGWGLVGNTAMLNAVLLAAVGYVSGGKLSQEICGWRAIFLMLACWSLRFCWCHMSHVTVGNGAVCGSGGRC